MQCTILKSKVEFFRFSFAHCFVELWKHHGKCHFIAEATLPPFAVKMAGAPQEIAIEYRFKDHQIEIDLNVLNKTSTRLPEAMWLRFFNGAGNWALSKLGEKIDPMLTIVNGSHHLHGIDQAGAIYTDAKSFMRVQARGNLTQPEVRVC
jgi:hypothetical protein